MLSKTGQTSNSGAVIIIKVKIEFSGILGGGGGGGLKLTNCAVSLAYVFLSGHSFNFTYLTHNFSRVIYLTY